ncbi:MAG: DNA replication/repair protein RecF [Actinomycetaceae bacterium]|nr:DNA replication/repair protein RecF [Actinomycetaceae bacterium]
MYISHLALDDFRSYIHDVIEFRRGVTVILGPNGQGKTNLIEAVNYLAHLSSHRVAADTALVRFPLPGDVAPAGAVIRAKVHAGDRERIVELEIVRGRANRARLNRNPIRPREILGQVKVVLFAPEDLNIVKGDPSDRRRFLDDMGIQMWPTYGVVKSDLDRILRQRAALLKQLGKDRRSGRPVDLAGLSIWNDQLIDASTQIVAYRQRLLDDLVEPANEMHHIVSEGARELTIAYENSLTQVDEIDAQTVSSLSATDPQRYSEMMKHALDTVCDQEINRGVNLVGPHRDDLGLWLDGMPVKGYASHGESWSVALSLKLGAFEVLSTDTHRARDGRERPILILDDVFAELDEYRRRALVRVMEKAEQVLITAAAQTDVPHALVTDIVKIERDGHAGSRCISAIRASDDNTGLPPSADNPTQMED